MRTLSMEIIQNHKMQFKKVSLAILIVFINVQLFSQVQLRDTILTWQHHSFELNDDYSMKSYTTDDNDIQQVEYSSAKIIENELIQLVVVPEYGARIISFYYKPTGHEYLYQSECGSPYGISDGNFYYDWLMVWGGIFPTFPEPEHGKAWLLPWRYTVDVESADTITVSMEYTDSTLCASAPGSFTKGVTGITCKVEISVYKGSSVWDYDVTLLNNKGEKVNYEYWTCTTLTPGCEIGETGSSLNTEMIVPFDKYKASWSPGSWIGQSGSLYDMSNIDYLSKWDDMGIAYANNLNDNYWGVINHDNAEGIIRISDNIETPGMKFWTWGKDEVDNDMFDISNGGKDNYIELWAGVSEAFFSNASLNANESNSWKESYAATYNLESITSINTHAAVSLNWVENAMKLSYGLNTFRPAETYAIELYLDGQSIVPIDDKTIQGSEFDVADDYLLESLNIDEGNYTLHFNISDSDNNLLLAAQEDIYVPAFVSNSLEAASKNTMLLKQNTNSLSIELSNYDNYKLAIVGVNGQTIKQSEFTGTETSFDIQNSGLYIIRVSGSKSQFTKKVVVQ